MTKPHSVWKTIGRAFFGSFFGIIGVFLGLVTVSILVIVLVSGKGEFDTQGGVTVLPEGTREGIRLTYKDPLLVLIDVTGVIGTKELNSETIREQLARSEQGAFKKGRVKGLLLNINTPGGSAFDSDTIYRLIKAYKERHQIPVYAYVNGLCASGGVFVSCAVDKIFASEVSIVGSVGVIANFFNIKDTLEKIGVKPMTLTKGKDKDLLNPFRAWKEGEAEEFQKIIDFQYNLFVNAVTSNRPIDKETLINKYGAHVFPAPQSLEYGYIDALATTRREVIEKLAETAGIADKKYQVVQLQAPSLLKQLLEGSNTLLSGKIKHELDLPKNPLPEGVLYIYPPLAG